MIARLIPMSGERRQCLCLTAGARMLGQPRYGSLTLRHKALLTNVTNHLSKIASIGGPCLM